jgi:hypothetical protein
MADGATSRYISAAAISRDGVVLAMERGEARRLRCAYLFPSGTLAPTPRCQTMRCPFRTFELTYWTRVEAHEVVGVRGESRSAENHPTQLGELSGRPLGRSVSVTQPPLADDVKVRIEGAAANSCEVEGGLAQWNLDT